MISGRSSAIPPTVEVAVEGAGIAVAVERPAVEVAIAGADVAVAVIFAGVAVAVEGADVAVAARRRGVVVAVERADIAGTAVEGADIAGAAVLVAEITAEVAERIHAPDVRADSLAVFADRRLDGRLAEGLAARRCVGLRCGCAQQPQA
ncbi:hypothetical protein EN753_14485 [Mesorhizobium sp. M2A.F.Ca.ET.029.05.1.1]|nr:hypothetical protein EJ068_15870 [Mesorhizobium sp. M2A.F.Ca.ET.043.02.1.1]RVD08350.1 hypothetical protein EN753_14485 [Mesorhizobium sp. M2A.F.Ca.ET.029.05.1.1]RWB45242.1 MAG: hypothetical protein EOQ46_10460 [Mesorhizobium sp.]RWB62911.1 MAG: hypothetical protein EOQ48_08275 [Mesorhizobium sp.]RWB87249.1 MAG: hypothetical protein EOQ51_09470 [Mesorhizobium sp.]